MLECKDFGVFIGTRASSKGGPFLVPFIESTSTLLQIEHVLLGKISGDDRNKVFIKGSFEFGPGAEVNRGLAEGSFLAILGPLTSSSTCYEHRPLGKHFKRHVTVGITPDRFKRVTSHLTCDRNTLTNTRYSGTPKSCNHNDTTGKWCHFTLFSHWIISRSEEHTSELQSRRDLVCRL